MERVNDRQNGPAERFQRQQATEHTVNEVEKLLRNSRESFELVRKLSPTRFRFRVVDKNGRDVRDVQDLQGDQTGTQADTHSTHVERPFCDQWMDVFHDLTSTTDWPGVAETAGHYRVCEPCP